MGYVINGQKNQMNVVKKTDPRSSPKVSVVICTLNEEANLSKVLRRIPSCVNEIVLVDGYSKDNTVPLAKTLLPSIRILYQPGKGKDDAMKHGFRNATGDIIVTLDADGSTDPTQIPEFVSRLQDGYDFSKGSRFLEVNPVMPVHRIVGNRILTLFTNMLYGTRYTDVCCGYNAFWKECLKRIDLPDNHFDYEPVLMAKISKAGLRVAEVQCRDRGRLSGNSKLPMPTQGLKAAIAVLRQRLIP
jgi:glycosyltransferase involved in cell wall biosynthesis